MKFIKTILKKKSLFALLLAVVLFLCQGAFIIITDKSYSEYIYEGDTFSFADAKVEYSVDGIVEQCEPVHELGFYKLEFKSLKKGSTNATIMLYDENGNEAMRMFAEYHVGIFNILYKSVNGIMPDFGGYPVLFITAAVFFIIMGLYMLLNFLVSLKRTIYSYSTVFNCSLMILMCGLGFMFSALSVYLVWHYRSYQFSDIKNMTTVLLYMLILLSIVFVLIYSVSMIISNISLIRHEGFRVQNTLGIIISVCLTFGALGCAVMPVLLIYFSDMIVSSIIFAVIATLYVFFEIYLLSTKICGLIAAKHIPAYDKDYIIILGCGIKEDGTLLPLLRGRVDKAIEFSRKQLERTGKKVIFVPSGGQGSDEIISEGEAMKRYLLEQGIPEEQIMPETKSTNTLENMQFSKNLINDENAKVAFATTNYHVFRGGIYANQVKLNAEGIGSKTKWYFWPNAYIREFVGLIVSQKKKIIPVVLLVALFTVVTTILFI